MNPTAVFSKSGKGVQEASGKTSHLSRADRAVLAAFDGKITVADVAEKVGKPFDPKFEQLVEQLEKDGFVRQVSAGVAPPQAAQPPSRPGAGKAPPPAALGEELDFTIFAAPKPAAAKPSGPPVDLAAKAREEAERKSKEEHATSYKARQEIERARLEAEARAKAASQARVQAEAAAKAKADAEAKAKADAESSARAKAAEAEAKVRAEADAKVKAAREAAVRLAADAKAKAEADLQAKLEAERAKAREEAERIRKEAEEKSRREAEELRKTLEEERKAREEAEAARRRAEEQAREEAERARREAEEKAREEAEAARKRAEEQARKEAEELRQRLEEERKAREEAEAARKKAEEQAREEERRRREEEERRQREEQERAERKAREEKERAEREEKERAEREKQERAERERAEKERAEREKQERKEREREEKERKQREEKERKERERVEREEREREEKERKEREKREKAEREEAERQKGEREKAEEKVAAAPAGNFSDSLLADLDSFGQREDDERKAREEADAAKKKAEQQARAEAERRAREEAERREKEEAERRKREEAERKGKEEAERRAEQEQEEAEARAAEERKRKAREALAAKAAPEDDDIGVTDEDLDMDEVKRDQKAMSQEARRAAREREREAEKAKSRKREDAEEEAAPVAAAAPQRVRRPMKWGKPAALALFVLLAAGVGVVHVMPVSTGAYEKAASEALGVPVKIGSARVSLFTGVQLKMDNVTAGPAKIATVRAFPGLGSLLGDRKSFSRIELEGVSLPQEAVGAVLTARARSENFEVERLVAQKVKLEGPLVLPALDADLAFGAEGSVASGTLRGPEGLVGKLAPKGADVEFEVHAGSFALPVAPEVTLNTFDMKGVAGREGMEVSAWSASLYDGVVSGTAKLAWGSSYSLDGVVTVRGMNVGVFAPALVSEGKVEGTGRFSMSGADAGKLGAAARLEGNFTITKGVIGSFDISRALSTGGRQTSGRTPFTEMVGQGIYDKGAVQLRNVTLGAGALNAGASLDIAPGGALSGRIVADVRAATQTIRATLNLGGTVREPQVRN